MAPDASQFKELQGRLRALLIAVSDQLPRVTVELVGEMIDANECGVALETISDMLVESNATIRADVVTDVGDLATAMGLAPANAERLRPLVGDNDDGAL